MTNKKRRQRGTRTHGGGSAKNRRGAGHRGGRGNAGRKKHEIHGQEPLGKHGFTRPAAVLDEVATVNVGTLDEQVSEYLEAGLAEETDDGILVDVRAVLDVDEAVDRVKVLGGGRVTRPLVVQADEFSDGARAALEAAGGEARANVEP
ncbi:MAG: uL15m family ribosomal protein [Halobacteriales archaeon]